MSFTKTVATLGGPVNLTRFYGGKDRGQMIQLTLGGGYVQMTPEEFTELLRAGAEFASDATEATDTTK